MAIDFPDSPSTNDTYTVNGRTYIWNGEKWLRAQPELTSVVPTLTVSNDFTVDTDTLHVDSTNNRVGIGTSSPASSLEVHTDFPKITLTNDDQLVSANAYFAGIEMRDSSENLAGAVGFISGEDQDMRITSYRAGADLHLVTGGANNERVTVTDTGNVGIGTTSPLGTLNIGGNSTTLLFTSPSDTNRYRLDANISDSADYGLSVGYWDGSAYQRTMTFTDNGRVGIGTTGPLQALHVNGMILADMGDDGFGFERSGTQSAWALRKGGTGSLSPDAVMIGNVNNNYLEFWANNTRHGFMRSDGALYMTAVYGDTNAAGANMVILSSGQIMRSTSSAKYKTDIETLDEQHADLIYDLRPVWYRSNIETDIEGYSYYGLIAEEVAEVDPRLVHFGASLDCSCVAPEGEHLEHTKECLSEPEGVQYDRIVPHLISVAQRQKEIIDALTARIEALEGN